MKKSLKDSTKHVVNQPQSMDFGGRSIINANLVNCKVDGDPVGPGGGGGGSKHAITYDAQSLTDSQKSQARANIGAGSAADIAAAVAAVANEQARAVEAESTLQQMVADADRGEMEVSWDGASTPVVANIPAGVSVTYGGSTYTGTLEASASTKGKLYLVSDGNGNATKYGVSQAGSTFSWVPMGTTEINLANLATRQQVSQLQQEVDGDDAETQIQPFVQIGNAGIDYATGRIARISTTGFTVYGFRLPAQTVAIKVTGRQGATVTLCMVSFFKDDEFLASYLQNTGTAGNVIKRPVTIPDGANIVYIAGSSNSASHRLPELYALNKGLSGAIEKQWKEIEGRVSVDYTTRPGFTISRIKPNFVVKYNATINSSGRIVTLDNASNNIVAEYNIPQGVEKLVVNGRRGASDARYMIAYLDSGGEVISTDIQGLGSNAKDIIGYESTVPVGALVIRVAGQEGGQEPEVIVPSQTVKIDETQEVNVLCIGNSYTYDAFSYLPTIAKRAFPKVKLNVLILHQGHCSLAEHLANITDDVKYPEVSSYQWDSDSWLTTTTAVTVREALQMRAWDIVVLQQNSANSSDYSTYQPYLGQIIDKIAGMVSYPVKFGWLLTKSWADGYSSLSGSSDEMFEAIVACARRVMDETPIQFLIPAGTATQNARHTTLDSLGTFGHLTYDGTHLNEGIPCLVEAYATLLSLADLVGYSFRSIFGDSTRPTDAYIAEHNIPGQNGTSVGVSDANVLLAQKCAVMANKHPYSISTGIE